MFWNKYWNCCNNILTSDTISYEKRYNVPYREFDCVD